MPNTIFTIGHSNHSSEYFIHLLKKYRITAICDVRSTPYSRLHQQFNQDAFKIFLKNFNIKYAFLGKELGARSDDDSCYEHEKVQFNKLANTRPFQGGLERIREGMQYYTISLMCAEKEPLDCHRTILVSRYLNINNISIQHIHADGVLESHEHAMQRLLRKLHLTENHLFQSRDEIFSKAYAIQAERIAYTRPSAFSS